jgi:hypothetical protein
VSSRTPPREGCRAGCRSGSPSSRRSSGPNSLRRPIAECYPLAAAR